jgi:branched-subunit amino acid aminotransferase/4-amino-4-deoxychorismate lyase
VTLFKSSYSRLSARAMPVRYKLCQGLNSTLARLEAAEHKCFDALLLNDKGQLCETSSANIFWFRNGILYTPSLKCGILKGATRAAVMRLSPYPVKEVEAGIKTLKRAEAVFITNSVWKAVAVERLLPLDYRWNSTAIARRFQQLLSEDRKNYCKRHRKKWHVQKA